MVFATSTIIIKYYLRLEDLRRPMNKKAHFFMLCVCVLDGVALDGDDPEHIQWVFQRSLERASEFNITGVTYRLTQGEYK